MDDATTILQAAVQGDERASNQLIALVYDELHRIAAAKLARERPGQTLQATALVHEAYLRLIGDSGGDWENRRHFFAAAAEAMRRILVERARHKARIKHGGGVQKLEFNEADAIVIPDSLDLVALNEALERLTQQDPEKAELVKLHFFGGLSIEDAGDALKLSRATAYRYWQFARAWLYAEVCKGDTADQPGD